MDLSSAFPGKMLPVRSTKIYAYFRSGQVRAPCRGQKQEKKQQLILNNPRSSILRKRAPDPDIVQ